jgi:hypothetical protein
MAMMKSLIMVQFVLEGLVGSMTDPPKESNKTNNPDRGERRPDAHVMWACKREARLKFLIHLHQD